MRYAFISDVHGNLEALSAILAHLEVQQVQRIIFLGDAVGYGPNPNEVCDLIRAQAEVSILGNHDAAVAGRMDYSTYYDAAKRALDWCVQTLTPANMAWLREMPYSVREGELTFCHGAPARPAAFEYLFSAEQVLEMGELDELSEVTFIGHSHLALAFRLRRARPGAAWEAEALQQDEILCRPEQRLIITVGSVGQPRDRNPLSCCGVFDSTTRLFEYHRVAYDAQTTRQKILAAGLPPMFGERLLFGI